jgi:TM2 domain-containing membrane protein YozV
MKSKRTAYLLWFFWIVGLCGLHRIYIGKVGTGILWLLTGGLLMIGQIVDLFTLGMQVDIANTAQRQGVQTPAAGQRPAE